MHLGSGSRGYGTLYVFRDELIIAWSKDQPRFGKARLSPPPPGRLAELADQGDFDPETKSRYTILVPPADIASVVVRTRGPRLSLLGHARIDLVPRHGRKMSFEVTKAPARLNLIAELLDAALDGGFKQRF